MVGEIAGNRAVTPGGGVPVAPGKSGEFQALLRKEMNDSVGVRFSSHAEKRLREKNINFTADDLSRLGCAMQAAAAKGTREVLLLYGEFSLIASTVNKTVVTAVTREEGQVFTNIDGAVIIK